jgi:hypothetical protein
VKAIRFSTFLRDCGPVRLACSVTPEEWTAAVEEGRFATIYHGESDFCTPLVGIVRHGMVNTICKIVFARPLPAGVDTIIGMQNSEQAWDLCNP